MLNVDMEIKTVECNKLESDVQKLKKDKIAAQKRCSRKESQNVSLKKDIQILQKQEHNETEKKLKEEIKHFKYRIMELEEINQILQENEIKITTFENGRYTDALREKIMSLVLEYNVSGRKVNKVIDTVMRNLTGKLIIRLPSAGCKSRILIEAKHVAAQQVAEAMLNSESSVLHQDATTHFHKHMEGFQISTSSNETLSVGLQQTSGGIAEDYLKALKTVLQ